MNYQYNLQLIAKELTDIWLNAPEGADVFSEMAAHAIKKMASQYRSGCFSMRTYHQSPTELKLLRDNIDATLKEQGLIPDQEPPKESAFEHDPNGSIHNPDNQESEQEARNP